ncbi:MAG: insulinase family protein [Bacteroidetes bacterium]|nr:insulinase family protein [Bacteroidota bacterium]
MHIFSGQPKEGQTLVEVKNLLLEQIEKVKKGEFDEQLLKSIIANQKVEKMQQYEENQGRATAIMDAFCMGRDWADVTASLDQMNVVVYKQKGEDKTVVKVDKPEIHPVEVNREDRSDFLKMILAMPSNNMQPQFIDYAKDIQQAKTTGGVPIYYVKNTENKLFSLYYVLDMGKNNDKKLPISVGLLQFLGTDKYSADDISKEFYKLACNFGVNTTDEQTFIYLNGLEENFDASVALFEHLLTNAKPDQNALNSMIARTLKGRADAKLNKGVILQQALRNYAIYGKNNPFTNILSEAELKSLKADDLVNTLRNITTYQHKVFYYGSRDLAAVNTTLSKLHKTPAALKPYPTPTAFVRNDNKENIVYFTDYKMVQAEILWVNKSGIYSASKQPTVSLFNEYFGGGMSSIVFQTIRESKALAYSSYSRYTPPTKANDPYYIIAYIGTQADKMNDAIPAMNELLNDMPKTEKSFDDAKQSLRNQIETDRVRKINLLFNYDNAKRMGLDHDIRSDVYTKSQTLTYADINTFFVDNYKEKPFSYCIIGSKDKIKTTDLAKYGRVVELSLEEIFGY